MSSSAPQFAFSSSVFANAGMTLDQANGVWLSLRKAITEIQHGNASTLRFEELYRNSYTLVLHKHGELLYDGVYEVVAEQLRSVARSILETQNDLLLEKLVTQWNHHKVIMTMIRDILMYMDKTYCKLQKKVLVYEMGLLQFRDLVVRHPTIKSRLQEALLSGIQREREGELIDRQLIKHALLMLVEVNVQGRQVYVDDFENDFLKTTQLFYKQESQQFLAHNTVPDYLRKVQERLVEEEKRARDYLDTESFKKLMAVVEQELIANYAETLVENQSSGCRFLFQHSMIDDLKRMYTLFSRVPSTLDQIRALMSTVVKSLGETIVQEQETLKDPMRFVQDVLDLRSKYSAFVETAFVDAATRQPDRQFGRSLKDAFESFINHDSRSARHLCTYIDDMLRKGLKDVAESEVDEKLEQVIVIFRYLQDKDVFEDFYKKHLASRLLQGKRVSDDIEKLMISKLRTECGHQFTTKLESMFKDMTMSEQLMSEFRTSPLNLSAQRSDSVELSVSVLTSGSWPLPNLQPCVLPSSIASACDNFKQFYCHRQSGRRLQWLTSHGSADLKCEFKGGAKELQVHTYQMCILELYNTASTYTFQQIREMTAIPESELRRHLLSLAHPKIKVLAKTPSTKEIQDNHTFSWNDSYTSPLYRVKILLLSSDAVDEKSANANETDLPEGVLQSRQNSVEAAIVRIMKARKTLEHNQLVIEVTKQMSHRFVTDANFIKKRIEFLIEKEYLERDQDNRRLYHYLA